MGKVYFTYLLYKIFISYTIEFNQPETTYDEIPFRAKNFFSPFKQD